jgi:hypothetical protein
VFSAPNLGRGIGFADLPVTRSRRRNHYLRILFFFLVPYALYFIPAMLPSASAANVTLAWDSNQEPDLDGYVVYRNVGSPGPPYGYSNDLPEDELANPLHPEVTLTGLVEDKPYYIALTAYNTEGVESSFSNDVCVKIIDGVAEACAASSSITAPTSSGGGGGSGSDGSCFISTALYYPSDNHLMLYFLVTLTVIGIGTCAYKKTVRNQ